MKLVNILFLFVLVSLFPLSALAAGPTISLTPSPLELSVDQVVPLAVKVTDVEGLYGFDIRLKFDPAVVQVEDADPNMPGVQWRPGDFLAYDFPVKNEVDNTAGTAWFAMTQMNPSTAKNGTGTLVSLYLKGKAAGRGAVEIVDLTLANRNGEAVAAAKVDAAVRVTAGGPAQPANPTPLPTAPQPKLEMTPATSSPMVDVPAPTATPKVVLARPATAAPTTAVVATTAAVGTQAAPASGGGAAAATLPAATISAPEPASAAQSTSAAPAGAAPAAAAPASSEPAAQPAAVSSAPSAPSAASTDAPAQGSATAVLAEQPAAPTHVAAVTQPASNGALLLAGVGLLVAAAAGLVVLWVRRGR